jgi:hypothetical protein
MKPEPMKKKATRKELINALTHLTEWATGTNKDGVTKEGNPYCKDVIKRACQVIAKEKGHNDYLSWNE